MRKFLITALMVLGLTSLSLAQNVEFNIVKTDGTTTSHVMNTNTKIYYSDTQLFLDNNGTTVSYNLSELRKAYFTTQQSTEEVENQQLTIYPNPAKDVLNIKNLADNQEVTIYSINGAVVMKTIASGNLVSKFIKM